MHRLTFTITENYGPDGHDSSYQIHGPRRAGVRKMSSGRDEETGDVVSKYEVKCWEPFMVVVHETHYGAAAVRKMRVIACEDMTLDIIDTRRG